MAAGRGRRQLCDRWHRRAGRGRSQRTAGARPGTRRALATALKRPARRFPSFASPLPARARERVDQDLTRESMARRVNRRSTTELLGEVVSQSSAEEAERLPESPAANPLLRRARLAIPTPRRPTCPQLGGCRGSPAQGGPRPNASKPKGSATCAFYWAGAAPAPSAPVLGSRFESSSGPSTISSPSRRPGSAPGRAIRAIWRLVKPRRSPRPASTSSPRAPGRLERTNLSLCGRSAAAPALDRRPPQHQQGGWARLRRRSGEADRGGEVRPALPRPSPVSAHEAEVLRRLGRSALGLSGIPRLRRSGPSRRPAWLSPRKAIEGVSLLDVLNAENFEEMALGVTRVLIELAEGGGVPAPDWRQRLRRGAAWHGSSRGLRGAISPEVLATAPHPGCRASETCRPACEHRDCSPWNVVLDPARRPGACSTGESAEPDGLPGMEPRLLSRQLRLRPRNHSIENGRTASLTLACSIRATPFGRIAGRGLRRVCKRAQYPTPPTSPAFASSAGSSTARSDLPPPPARVAWRGRRRCRPSARRCSLAWSRRS